MNCFVQIRSTEANTNIISDHHFFLFPPITGHGLRKHCDYVYGCLVEKDEEINVISFEV